MERDDKIHCILRYLDVSGHGRYLEKTLIYGWLIALFPEWETEGVDNKIEFNDILSECESRLFLSANDCNVYPNGDTNKTDRIIKSKAYTICGDGIQHSKGNCPKYISDRILPEKVKDAMLLELVLPKINTFKYKINLSDISEIIHYIVTLMPKHERLIIYDLDSAFRMFDFLKENGFVEQIGDSEYKLSNRGKNLISEGNYDNLISKEVKDKKDASDKIERENEFIRYQAENSKWQKKWGNKLVVSNIAIAFMSMVASGAIAVYVSKKEKPIINNIELKVDTSVLKNLIESEKTKQQSKQVNKNLSNLHSTSSA